MDCPRAVECSSSSNEARSSGSHARSQETTGLSGNHDLVKTAVFNCRTAGDAGSTEVHGGLQQPAGDGRWVDGCTPTQRNLPSKEETVTPACEQAVAATTSVSTSFPANEKVGGPTGNDHCPLHNYVDNVVLILGFNYWYLTCVL